MDIRKAFVLVILLLFIAAGCLGFDEKKISQKELPQVEPAENKEPTEEISIEENKQLIEYRNPITYASEYTFELKFNEYNVINSLSAYVPTPTEWDSQKNVELISFSPEGKINSENIHDNKFIFFDRSNMNKNTLSTKQTFNFTEYEISTNTKIENIPEYNTSSSIYVKYTKDENKIERNYFVNISSNIIGNEKNKIKQAKKIYDYIINNLQYKLQGGHLKGAKFAYENKEGECGDYSALFVAMARSIGIPSRPVVGFWADPSYGKTHVWAEFYVQDIGWIPVDPTIGQQSNNKRDYYFGNMDNKRLIMSKDYNIQVDENKVDLFQIGAFWWYGEGNDPVMNFQYNKK